METTITRSSQMINLLNEWIETQIEEQHQTRLVICRLIRSVLAVYCRMIECHSVPSVSEHPYVVFSDLDLAHYKAFKSLR